MISRADDSLVLKIDRSKMKSMVSADYPFTIILGDAVSKLSHSYQITLRASIYQEAHAKYTTSKT